MIKKTKAILGKHHETKLIFKVCNPWNLDTGLTKLKSKPIKCWIIKSCKKKLLLKIFQSKKYLKEWEWNLLGKKFMEGGIKKTQL
jgi:hypothetical protein